MTDYLVFEKAVDGPATHAIVIGVGKYPHLVGGDGRFSTDWNDGMGQLSSPPISARKFTDWLISDYHNPGHPLATVSLLVSESDKQPYVTPEGTQCTLKPAIMSNAKPAIREWKRRGDENESNLLFFYFCGHGTMAGSDASLLLEDFGKEDEAPLDGAIDFHRFHLGMNRCKAKQQVYFIDACRVSTSAVLDTFGEAGDSIITGLRRQKSGKVGWQAPVFYSTLAGALAYSRENCESQFTESLLTALKGAADDADEDEKWRIKTSNLNQGIASLMQRAVEKGEAQLQMNALRGEIPNFPLHELREEPVVPVFVGCKPKEANHQSELNYDTSTGSQHVGPGSKWGWDLKLTPGEYSFKANYLNDPDKKGERNRTIRPPMFYHVRVEVK